MSIVWPQAKAGLLALLPTLDGFVLPEDSTDQADCIVYNGAPDSGDSTQGYFAVGWTVGGDTQGNWKQTPDGSGFFDEESGEVFCSLSYVNGDGDRDAAEAAAYALIDQLAEAIKDDRTLNGALPQASTAGLSAEDDAANTSGAGVLLVVSLAYTSPIT